MSAPRSPQSPESPWPQAGPAAALAGAGTGWRGAPALAGGKAYASCPLGQLHYRLLGDAKDARTPLVLLHQTPFGLFEWVDIQPRLAAGGRRVVAPDNPGFGLSDPPHADVTVPQLADNLLGLLDVLNIERAVLAGHHTGAGLAAAFAARHPARTAALVLQGCPLFDADERRERLARPAPSFDPQPDGSHLAAMFRAIHAIPKGRPDALATATWATLGSWLAGPAPPTYRAVFAHDMRPDVLAISAPTLVLGDRGDVLHAKDLQVVALRPDFELEEFSADGSFALMLEPLRWAARVEAFLQRSAL